MINYGDNWSNQAQLVFAANETGDFITLGFTLTAADTFDIAAYFGKASGNGIVNLKIDDQILGMPVDLYWPFVQRSSRLKFGSAYLTAASHRVTLEVAGKNSASTGYWLSADDLLLTSHYLLSAPPDGGPTMPQRFQFAGNYPNPFNLETRLQFDLPHPGRASLKVYDLAGRLVTILKEEWMSAGEHHLDWKANQLSSGIYFAVLQQGNQTAARKLLLLK